MSESEIDVSVMKFVARAVVINLVGGTIIRASIEGAGNREPVVYFDPKFDWHVSADSIVANRACIPDELEPFDEQGNLTTNAMDLAWRRIIVSEVGPITERIQIEILGWPVDCIVLDECDVEERKEAIASVLPDLEPGDPSYNWIRSAEYLAHECVCHFWPVIVDLSAAFVKKNAPSFHDGQERRVALDPTEIQSAILNYWTVPHDKRAQLHRQVMARRYARAAGFVNGDHV